MKTLTSTLFALFTVSLLLFYGCDSGHDHEHADAVGFTIEQNNVEIIRFENNQFELDPSGTWGEYYREIDGEQVLTISPDVIDDMTRGMTPSLTIRWIDADGDKFDLEEEEDGGELWLDWQWAKPNTLTEECTDAARTDTEALDQIRPVNIEQHGSDGSWGFHFRADHAGVDEIRFRLMHGFGDAAHADFVAGWMKIAAAEDEHELIDENGIYLHDRDKCRTR